MSRWSQREPIEPLTNQQQRILELIAEGFSNQQIATHLSISINTVNAHRTNIMKKMEMNSNSELIRYALQNGLVK